MNTNINVPDIYQYDYYNPTLHSPSSEFDIPFAQTKESFIDVEVYRKFLENLNIYTTRTKDFKSHKTIALQP